MEAINQRGKQLLGQDAAGAWPAAAGAAKKPPAQQAAQAAMNGAAAGRVAADDENRPMIRRAESGHNINSARPTTAEGNNVFKQDEQQKPRTPGIRGNQGAAADAWPAQKPKDDMDNMIKNYIKDVNKLIDQGVSPVEAEDDDDDEDDDNIEEIPTVPETDENSKQAARDDDIDDDNVEESKERPYQSNLLEESKLMEQLALPPEPFRLDELRISAPMLRNELHDSLAFFRETLVENYGSAKFRAALAILEQYERDGHDRYTEQGENQLIRQLEGAVFRNNESQARQFLYESASYLLIKNAA